MIKIKRPSQRKINILCENETYFALNQAKITASMTTTDQ